MKPFLFAIILLCMGWATPVYAIIDIVSVHNCSSTSVCDGQITVAATGTAGPFTFLWSNGATTSTVSNLCAGPYSVTVTNRIDCQVVLSTYVYTCQPTSNNSISISGTVHNATQPTDSDGSIDVTLTFGSYQFTSVYYHWTGPNGFASASEDISGVPPGTYHLNVTSGCASAGQTFVIGSCSSASSAPVLSILPNAVAPFNCTPGNHAGGGIDLSISSNFSPFTYQWSGPSGFTATSEDIRPLNGDGDYCVTVTDRCGVTATTCQYMECCNERSIPYAVADNPCLGREDFLGIWQTSPGTLRLTGIPSQPVDKWCNSEFMVQWSIDNSTNYITYDDNTGAWEGTTEKSVPSSAGGTYYVTVTNSCGCTRVSRAYFGGGLTDEAISGFRYSTLDAFLNDIYTPEGQESEQFFWDPYLPVLTGCFNCEACGIENGASDVIGMEYCTNKLSSTLFSYKDDNPGDNDAYPCKGGTVYCEVNGTSWEIPVFLEGTPIIDYTATPISLPTTPGGAPRCKYPVHCIFPPGYLDGFSTYMPVVVENPEGYIETGSNCASAPTNTNACSTGIPILDQEGIGKDCVIHWVCSNDPTIILETIKYDDLIKICECYSTSPCATVNICTVNPTIGAPCNAFEIVYDIPCNPSNGDIVACVGARPADQRSSIVENVEITNIKVYPNPFNGNITIDFKDAGYFTNDVVIISIENILGENIFYSKNTVDPLIPSSISLDNYDLPRGSYILNVQGSNKPKLSFIIVKSN